MTSPVVWQDFRRYAERGPAEALCALMRAANVPCTVEARSLEAGVESQFCVLVPSHLAHRARWVASLPPLSEEELVFLATGKLPGDEEHR
jgi:hypothetical protein